jgi:hypothetical protein
VEELPKAVDIVWATDFETPDCNRTEINIALILQ